jgi:hypothetical protein
MMTGQKKLILAGAVILVLLVAALAVLLSTPPEDQGEKEKEEVFYLLEHRADEIARILVENQYGSYEVKQESGGFLVHDIPSEL